MKKRYALLCQLVVLLALPTSVLGQVYGRGAYVPPNYTYTVIRGNMRSQNMLVNSMIANRMARITASARGRSSASTARRGAGRNAAQNPTRATGSTAAPPVKGTTAFRSVSATIFPQQMAAKAAQNPTDKRELEAFFAQCLKNYEANMRREGQPVKDVARAVSYMAGVSYNIYHGGNALSAGEGAALRAEIKTALEQDERFQNLSNRERQEMYETMAVMAEFVAISADVAAQKGNQQLAEMAKEMAKENLESLFGVPASQIRITDAGLEF